MNKQTVLIIHLTSGETLETDGYGHYEATHICHALQQPNDILSIRVFGDMVYIPARNVNYVTVREQK